MNTNKAWSLNISTAAQWNSGLENLLTSITDIHLLQKKRTKLKGKGDEKNCKASCWLRVRCHHIYRAAMFLVFSLIPLGAVKLMEGDICEGDRRAQWWEQGFAD